MAIELPWIETPLKCGNLHGAPMIHSPQPKIHRRHFFGNNGEVEISGGRIGRKVVLNAILNDSTWTDSAKVFTYMKTALDSGIGVNGTLNITFPESATAVFKFCTFESYDLIPQPGHQMVAPLKDVTGMLNGTADTWWLEVNLNFYQLQTGPSDSTFSAS